MARITKAMIYEKYGIIFRNDHIVSPIGEICELLKDGNTKVGKTVMTFSLLAGTAYYTAVINGIEYTEKGTCACNCEGCYAQAGRYNCESVITSLVINTYLVNNHIDFVKRAIMAQLETIGDCEIRIHASGDFKTSNPEAYANMWHDIAERFANCTFWTYTKVRKFETLFDDLNNANIVKSIIPNIGVNYGHCDYIISTYYALKAIGASVYICKCGFDKDQHCAGCGVCTNYDYVLFLEHSTDYNAKKDPLYSKLYNIVMNQ